MTEESVRTIADIARLAGVSKSTVSRALNNSPLISDETKARIQTIARQHNFHIHQPARRLSLKKSNTIAFVTHGLYKEISIEDIFQMEMLGSISSAVAANNYDLLMLYVDPDEPGWIDQYWDTGRVDGFILMTMKSKAYHIEALVKAQAPFIVWGVPIPGLNCCSVTGSNLRGGRLAAGHLAETGRKRIAFLGGPKSDPEVALRYQGHREALQTAGLHIIPDLVMYGDYSSASGEQVMRKLLAQSPRPDAVFANNDLIALGAMRAIHEIGLRIPEDVSVIGYDDVSIAQHSNPPLTTIRQNIPESGRLLVQNLIQYLETGVVTNVSVPVDLVVRKSTLTS